MRKQKRAYLSKAAGYVADLMLDSLEQFPEEERKAHLNKAYAALRRNSRRFRSEEKHELRGV